MEDVECPYCNDWIEIDHDDGYGYEENELHQQDCAHCGKTFTYNTTISFSYDAYPAPCLNGEDHNWKERVTYPKEFTRMICSTCEDERQPTEEEWVKIDCGVK